MRVVNIFATCLAVFAIASCGSDSNNNNNDNGDTDNNTDNNQTPTHALTLSTGAHGTLAADPPGGTYEEGTVVTLTATPAAGYKVAAWTGTDDDTSTSPTNHVTMSADKTVGISFAAVSAATFTLTVNQHDHGTVAPTPAGPTYTDGTAVLLTATPEAGYTVDTWSGTDDDSRKTLTNHVTMTADKTVSATFKVQPPQKTLNVTIDEAGSGITGAWGFKYSPPTPAVVHYATAGLTFSTTFDVGTTVTLTGLAAAHWPVTSWSGPDVPAGHETDCTITLTMDTDKSVTINIPDSVGASICP